MATGTVQFQFGTLSTPPPGLAVMADAVNDSSFGAGSVQYIKIMDGAAGGTAKAGVGAKGLAVDTGTVQVLGSIQSVGTNQALGTFQTFGTSQVLGSVQGVGTFQVLGSVQTVGTSQVLGSVQTVGTSQVLGTVQLVSIGTQQVLGSVQTVGTSQVLGSVQPVGTVQALGTVRVIPSSLIGENFFGTLFTAGQANGTLVAAPAQGTFVRVWDMMVSGSAAGTAMIVIGNGTIFAPGVFAANGGFVFNSSRGVRTHGTSQDIMFNSTSGTWGVSVNYSLET